VSIIEQRRVSNHLLAALPPADFARLATAQVPVDLAVYQTLFRAEDEVEAAYFVETGTISMLTNLADGNLVEVGMVGPDGMAGLPLVFDTTISPVQAMVQIPGHSWRIAAPAFRAGAAG